MNAQGGRHDVWLLYRCPGCGATRKRRIHRRARTDELGVRLEAYLRNDPACASAFAFALEPGASVPYRVVRRPLPDPLRLRIRIEQPAFCGLRWDRLLAGELGWSRSRVVGAWRRGHVAVARARRLSAPVQDGQEARILLPSDGRSEERAQDPSRTGNGPARRSSSPSSSTGA